MKRPEIRPATAADFEQFYGRPLPWTAEAWVADVDGRVIGIAGVYFDRGCDIAFSDTKPEIDRKTIVRGIRRFGEQFGGRRLIAVANPELPTAERLLCKLGFKPAGRCETGNLFSLRY